MAENGYNSEINDLFSTVIYRYDDRAMARVSNPENVILYWRIGKFIYKKLQEEKSRAAYSSHLIESLSKKLTFELGNGFSQRRLKDMRNLYINYPNFAEINPRLGWTQLRILMRIKNLEKRNFYINLCTKKNLSTRTLEAYIADCLYEQSINNIVK